MLLLFAQLIRTVLEQSGYAVFEATDGLEAVRTARESLPDLILLDLHMPHLHGVGTLQELRRDPKLPPHRSLHSPPAPCRVTASAPCPPV